jgi:lysophospholipase L1-like esterase
MRARTATLVSLIILPACGGSSPSDPGDLPTPDPGHPVSGVVFYDENGNGTVDAAEVVRLPGVTVNVGGRMGQTTEGGHFTVSGVPAGTQTAQVEAGGLPPYFTPGTGVSVSVPTEANLPVPATMEIGANLPNHYLAFGDSITAGEGGGPGNDYPAFLSADLEAYWGDAFIVNEGEPATRSNTGANRLYAPLARHRPAYTLILYGTNDWNDSACRGEGFPCYTIDSLRSMINQARGRGSNPIIGTIPPANPAYLDRNAPARNEWIVAMNELLRQMANEERVPVAEIHADFMAEPNLEALFVDHVHPTAEGYQIMARSWWNAITGAVTASRRSFGFSFTGS